jgi:hypothetical protein
MMKPHLIVIMQQMLCSKCGRPTWAGIVEPDFVCIDCRQVVVQTPEILDEPTPPSAVEVPTSVNTDKPPKIHKKRRNARKKRLGNASKE